MKPNLKLLFLLLWLFAKLPSLAAQTPVQQQLVPVTVVNAHADPAQPVAAVRVSLTYLDSGTRITEARDVTNPKGQAFLQVTPDVSQRGDLRIEITGAATLVIYQPADGQLAALPPNVTIQLLPKGSPALLDAAQIEALLHRTLLQVNSLQNQNRALQQQLKAQAQPQDLTAPLADWAQANGFPPSEVNAHVEEWAKEIQQNTAHATTQQQALAELALKHYDTAAQLFSNAAVADEASLDADEQAFLDARRTKLQQLLKDSQQSASSFQLNAQYHQATQALQALHDRVTAEQKKYPDDKGIAGIWSQATTSLANARRREAENGPANQSLALLAQSDKDYTAMIQNYTSLGDKNGLARAERGLGVTSWDEGLRASGAAVLGFFDQAVLAYEKALQIYTKADSPNDWALTQMDLGLALSDEQPYVHGKKGLALLAQSTQAYNRALEVFTKTISPQNWAATEMNLGIVFYREGQEASPADATALTQSIQAYNNALQVYTKQDFPEMWAKTQSDLGGPILEQARSAPANQTNDLLTQALKAYADALTIYTKDAFPQDWARVKRAQGLVLEEQARHVPHTQAALLLQQAIEANQEALQVFTQTDLPQGWAATQIDLGDLYRDSGGQADQPQSGTFYTQALQAYQQALLVDTEADLPYEWATLQIRIGNVLREQGDLLPGQQALPLLLQAEQAYRKTFAVFTLAEMPSDWSLAQQNLGKVLRDEAMHAQGPQANTWLTQAEAVFRQMVDAFPRPGFPLNWAAAQAGLGSVLYTQASLAMGDTASTLYDGSAQAYSAALEVYSKSATPSQWAAAQNGLGNALDDKAERIAPADTTQLIGKAMEAYQAALEVYTKNDEPHNWGDTESNFGITLNDAAQRSEGAIARQFYEQAAAAFQSALEIYTRSGKPQAWANAESNLGAALFDQARYHAGADASALLRQAVQADQLALEVRTQTDLPQDWKRTEQNLAEAQINLGDFAAADTVYEALLSAFPNDLGILAPASNFYHDVAFRYDRALDLDAKRLELLPDSATRLDFIEANLTAAHFDVCLQQIGILNVPANEIVQAFQLACQWGAGNKAAALATDQSLLPQAASFGLTGWNFTGDLHFLSNSPAFATGRDSWSALFTAIQNGDTAGVTTALTQLERLMSN